MRFISSNVESTGACAPSADLATPMSMMPGTSVNAPRGGEGVTRKVDGKRAPEVKVVLAFRVCEVEGECPSLGRVQRRHGRHYGLGLHAASEAASAHGGSVSLANSPSGGAVATIAVPL